MEKLTELNPDDLFHHEIHANARKELFPTPANVLLIDVSSNGQAILPLIEPYVRFIQIRGDFQPFCYVRHKSNG